MYPNPQDAVPLPPRPDVEQYRRRAKELVKACHEGGDAIPLWAARWVDRLFALHPDLPDFARQDARRRSEQITGFARERLGSDCTLSQAQFVLARAHGFASWPRLVHHIEALTGGRPDHSAFERAADAIVHGDIATLEQLLAEHPALVRERSTRDHRSTLLHYTSANGVESYRQRTPPNILTIAGALLDAGAEVDAEADVYGRAATTLALTVTSSHPRAAGLQIPLADLLLERGARIDPDIVGYCLVNGCPEAAAHMAERGAPVDLCAAAALGDLARVQAAFDDRGGLREEVWRNGRELTGPQAVGLALLFAYVNDQRAVVDALFERDGDWSVTGVLNGTALHRAAWAGDLDMVQRLVTRGADTSDRNNPLVSTPFGWAVHNRQTAVAAWFRASGHVDLHDAVSHDLAAEIEARLRDDPDDVNRRRDHGNIPAGTPLRNDALRSVQAVQQGQTVRVTSVGPGFAVSGRGNVMPLFAGGSAGSSRAASPFAPPVGGAGGSAATGPFTASASMRSGLLPRLNGKGFLGSGGFSTDAARRSRSDKSARGGGVASISTRGWTNTNRGFSRCSTS